VQIHTGIVYQFGAFEVNPASGELLKNGRRIRLQELPHRLLVALLENPGEVISREELRSRLWPARAVELLASASPYERAYPEAVYLRGLAYLRLHKGVEAAAEFQKILDHKGASWASTWRFPNWGLYYSISHVGLARASVLAGDTAKARKAFKDFFELWKDADQNLPILIEAKKTYAALH
jgi:tetratricopeptide (TPR) repeat protein